MGLCIQPLAAIHRREAFDCGVVSLHDWQCRVAAQHSKKGISASQVLVDEAAGDTVLAYYALTPCEIQATRLPAATRKKLPEVVPGIRLGRLAVDLRCRGMGYGSLMLVDAMQRSRRVALQIGGHALFVDATDQQAAGFYAKFGFAAFPDQPLTLFLPLAAVGL